MKDSTKKTLWVGGGLVAVFVAYAAGFKRGWRRGVEAQYAIAPAPTPPQVTQVSTVTAPAPPPKTVSLSLVPGAQAVSVPTGGSLQVYPPDANSSLLSFSMASGSATSVTSPAGPQTFTIRGSGTINMTWQDANKSGQSTAIAVTAT